LQRGASLPKRDFERILLEAVDEGLSSLGESSKVAVYFHLQKSFSIRKEEIPGRVEAFAEAIMQIFGPGATFLEILIMKRLHEKVRGASRSLNSEDFTFKEYVASTRRSLLQKDDV
jgi:hypothetical protein